MIVIGVDPGIANCGWAVVWNYGNSYCLLDSGVIKSKASTPTGDRLNAIRKHVISLIEEWSHENVMVEMGVEDVFIGRNKTSAISTGKVIGVLECLSSISGVAITIVNPRQVKASVLGVGKGSKAEVINRVNLLLKSNIKKDHEADACGVAIAVLLREKQPLTE